MNGLVNFAGIVLKEEKNEHLNISLRLRLRLQTGAAPSKLPKGITYDGVVVSSSE
ncbi:hypothetical protein JHK82_041917 [Glycine max]|nr:hypothetical protein JHK82_041917 [Glycine max]